MELSLGNHLHFSRRLPPTEHWRLYETFRSNAAYLDIETGEVDEEGPSITVIGLMSKGKYEAYVARDDMEDFLDKVAEVDFLVTFNGSRFDLPVLHRTFPGVLESISHVDLVYPARHLGFRGGLKKVEEMLGIERTERVKGLRGYDAPSLWSRHLSGDSESLDLLLEYNRFDVVNLEPIARFLCSALKQRFFGTSFTSAYDIAKGLTIWPYPCKGQRDTSPHSS